MTLIQLFFIFFYIGLVTIGGGLVGITVMQQILVEKYALISPETFYNMVAISESTPGPIGINMATYIGTELFGTGGGIITTLGQIAPSIIVITVIARFLSRFNQLSPVKNAFVWLKPATTGLILVAASQVFVLALINVPASLEDLKAFEAWKAILKWKNLLFYCGALVVLVKTKLHPVFVVALGAIFGVLFL